MPAGRERIITTAAGRRNNDSMQFNSDKIRTAAGKLLQSLRKCASILLSMIRAAGRLMKTLGGGLSAIAESGPRSICMDQRQADLLDHARNKT